MRKSDAKSYVDPADGGTLALKIDKANGDEVLSGALVAKGGARYAISKGIPDLTYPPALAPSDARERAYYDTRADEYDAYLPLTFSTFGVDETAGRNSMIDEMRLKPTARVLEHGCGSGRDSELIAKRLGPKGHLHMLDLSRGMLDKAVDRMAGTKVPLSMAVANGSYLPFRDRSFDATYHFGGLNTFADIERAFAEAVRVTKVGGRVVMGDESMPPWLRDTDFGRILMNSNPHYRFELPLGHMPIEARDVSLRWLLGGVFYVISFTVGEGEPPADLDFEIPGPRGGTHRTRYQGHLEGVTPAVKELATKARARSGKSMHAWLEDAIRQAAARDLGPNSARAAKAAPKPKGKSRQRRKTK